MLHSLSPGVCPEVSRIAETVLKALLLQAGGVGDGAIQGLNDSKVAGLQLVHLELVTGVQASQMSPAHGCPLAQLCLTAGTQAVQLGLVFTHQLLHNVVMLGLHVAKLSLMRSEQCEVLSTEPGGTTLAPHIQTEAGPQDQLAPPLACSSIDVHC